jgi:hypothetical protein
MYAYVPIPCTVSGRSQYSAAASSKSDTRRVHGNYTSGCASNQTQSLSVTLVFLIDIAARKRGRSFASATLGNYRGFAGATARGVSRKGRVFVETLR